MSSTLEGHISTIRDPILIFLNSNIIYFSQSLECATLIEVSGTLYELAPVLKIWNWCEPGLFGNQFIYITLVWLFESLDEVRVTIRDPTEIFWDLAGYQRAQKKVFMSGPRQEVGHPGAFPRLAFWKIRKSRFWKWRFGSFWTPEIVSGWVLRSPSVPTMPRGLVLVMS